MRLPKLAIENRAFVWMVMILLTLLGIRAYLTMPRTENPEVTIPGSSIVVVLPGATSMDMETLVALPLEEALNELEDITNISSELRDGLAVVSVEFEFNTDEDEKYDEVVQQVNSIRSTLPSEIVQLDTWQWSVADMNMMQLALVSDDATWTELEELAEDLQKEAEKIRSIRKVTFYGLPGREIHIRLDFEKMAMVNTSMDHVIRAIETNNMNIPGGELKIGGASLLVKSSGSFKDLEEIRNCVVNSHQGRLIYLKDLAMVEYGYEELQHLTRLNSRRCIFVGISQKEGLNVLETSEELLPVLTSFEERLPGGVNMEVIYDQPVTVRNRINGFVNNLLQGMVLVALVILLALGLRSSLVVALAIPLSLLIGIGFLDLAGYGLQQISIASMVVVLGMLVDNSIVIVENINRYLDMGRSRKEASIQAVSEIGWPVITATLTTILAFVPIAAMPEMAGEFIRSLPLTIMFCLLVSLLIALTFTPVITSRLFREKKKMDSSLKGFGRFLAWITEKPFRSSLKLALRWPFIFLILSVLYLGGSAWMFTRVGISFFPKAEQPNLMIQASMPEGTGLDRSDETTRYIESVLDTMPDVLYYASNVGHGNPRIYYNMFTHRNDKTFSEVYVTLAEYDPGYFAGVLTTLRDEFENYPGARIRVKEFEQGPPYDAPVQIFLTGKNMEVLRQVSSDVEAMIRDQPGAVNIENKFVKTNAELLFNINKEKANMLGVPVIEIDRTIRTVVAGLEVSGFRDPDGDEFPIMFKMKSNGDFRLEDLDRVYVSSLSGRQIPIRQFVDLQMQQGPSSVSRYDLERTAEILADIRPGYTLDDVMDPLLERMEAYSLPSGFSYHVAGELEGRRDTFGGMTNAVIIALVSIFALLVLQFRSLKQPMLVFIAIPFAFTGMVWALLVTKNTFSFTAFVGLTSLVGIVVNNSIILVDYINILRKRGEPLMEALQTASETRLKPILLTALTTIGGLIPLTLRGGTMWAPLGWTIIGGLLVSTLMTVIIIPVTYLLLERRNERTNQAA